MPTERRRFPLIESGEPDPFTASIRRKVPKGRIFIDRSELGKFSGANAFTIRDADQLLERAGSKLLADWSEAKQTLPTY